ncbi:MAG: alpha/beta fold hydrolase [Kofleriaceae bacterium]
MPSVRIASPLSPDGESVLHYSDTGGPGQPLLVLHGGWGACYYPFDAQVAALAADVRCVIPDRTGYGRSTPVTSFPPRFHDAAAIEAEHFLDALGIDRCAIWGHSDGAVIATVMALRQPARYRALVLEALHVECAKPSSRAFFTMMIEDPDGFGDRVTARLAADHGERWRVPIRADGQVWLDLAAAGAELYDHRLAELRVPTLLVHGGADPRTEPGELDRFGHAVPGATIHVIAGAGHSPHSERAAAAETTEVATAFLRANR